MCVRACVCEFARVFIILAIWGRKVNERPRRGNKGKCIVNESVNDQRSKPTSYRLKRDAFECYTTGRISLHHILNKHRN